MSESPPERDGTPVGYQAHCEKACNHADLQKMEKREEGLKIRGVSPT